MADSVGVALERELRRFGWTVGPDFIRRYYTDAWVFNLANALEAVVNERDHAIGQLEQLTGRPYVPA